MLSTQEVQGKWNSIRGKVKEKWGQLTDDDLQIASGNVDQLVGRIQQKTGETKQRIETFFNDLLDEGHNIASKAQGLVEQSGEALRDFGEQASDKVRHGYRRAEQLVQEYPASSVAGVFACGIVTGVFLGLLLARR